MVLSCLQRNPARRRCTPGGFLWEPASAGGCSCFHTAALVPFSLHKTVWTGNSKDLHWNFLCDQVIQVMFRPCAASGLWHGEMPLPVWEKKQTVKGLKSTLLPSFLVFSFASYTIFSKRNLQAIKCSRQCLLGAEPCVWWDPPQWGWDTPLHWGLDPLPSGENHSCPRFKLWQKSTEIRRKPNGTT